MIAVFDTSVVVAGVRSAAGASRLLLTEVLNERLALAVSTPLMLEYEAVLTRPEHLLASGLSSAEVGALLDGIAAVCRPVELSFRWRPTLRDADDDMVLETAINGAAGRIVTLNAKDFDGAEMFGVSIVSPGKMVKELTDAKE